MKLEPKKIGGNLPREDLEWLPTEPPIDERPFADSASDLAQGLDVIEIPDEDAPATMSDPSMSGAWQPLTSSEQAARTLGIEARQNGAPPTASPFEPGTLLDLCWIDGFRAGA
jgi:hypothetical protein